MTAGWLVTGGGGMLGTDLVARLRAAGHEVAAPARDVLDLRDPESVRAALDRHRPATVVNCAAWTAVDDAETDEDAALAVNGTAVRHLAAACAGTGATLVQISTDYVFDGTGSGPYAEDAPTRPANAYGRTKLAGERAVLAAGTGYVVRTAWLYGAHGPNFVRTMAGLAATRETVDVVADQRGQPTWTGDLADQVIALAGSAAPPGVYHGTSGGGTTWHGLAREVFTLLGLDPGRVRPTTSDRFPRPAPRPSNSVLGHGRWPAAGLPPIRDWREALHAAWPELR
ncbi:MULTISPECIES: dTDP-4-dehydrorhamnose reductase [Thermomonosporaceae]|uniref:dTDP-4-dehydrorhamnose reductase n=1 Tax=Thermomonosporaceae TaxID=2012 RepID=UPI00255AC4D6|nr:MULTISPECIES: dTDP-4-dehydrorhamnose reductase [Thermomonosporaceae]MDL4772341.1 dTDP-4-dehydrorhamnose reductase [Actinomadura xylanilytica]